MRKAGSAFCQVPRRSWTMVARNTDHLFVTANLAAEVRKKKNKKKKIEKKENKNEKSQTKYRNK